MGYFQSWRDYCDFQLSVRTGSRFVHKGRNAQFLKAVAESSRGRSRVIDAGTTLWRAQVGADWVPVEQDGEEVGSEPIGFMPERMKPLKEKAREGRANPKGSPCLYLATDKETAMGEVRPWLETPISVAQFKVVRDLRVVDCSLTPVKQFVFYFSEPEPEEKDRAVWSTIDCAFSEPVTVGDTETDYVPTQILADLFKIEGFDGLAYRSAVGDGTNLALFDLESAMPVGCHVFHAEKIKFQFEEIANPYWIEDGVPKRVVITKILPVDT